MRLLCDKLEYVLVLPHDDVVVVVVKVVACGNEGTNDGAPILNATPVVNEVVVIQE